MKRNEKMVELSLSEFQLLIEKLKDCQKRLKNREAIINLLNEQIKEYNEKFASEEPNINYKIKE